MKTALAILVCISVGLGALLFRSQMQLKATAASIEQALAEKNASEAQLAEAQSRVVNESELKRLKEDQREAIRLRGEVADLKQAVGAAQKSREDAERKAASAMAAPKKSQSAPAQLPEDQNPFARVSVRKAAGVLSSGHALVLGDFESSPGKHTFALSIPKIDPANPGSVLIETKFIEFGEGAKPELLAAMPKANANSLMTPEVLAAFLKSIENEPGVTILASPRIQTTSGNAGTVSITHGSANTPNGPVAFGPQVEILPTVGADGSSVHLAIEAKIVTPADPNAAKTE